jgi:wyosine [tRNA(Phe)-imidazoG37] synthetase (radical SAM superfamily)
VPDGEPTLDIHLGREIELLKPLGVKIAVITNSTLIWRSDVQADLSHADWVSLKVDAVREDIWRTIDRPHRALRLDVILQGVREFAKAYRGELVTETMLVKGVNDGVEHAEELAAFLGELSPRIAYLGIPTRPPAEKWVQAPDEERTNRIYQIVSDKVGHVECLLGYEGNAFAFTGDVEQDILSVCSVHPMREDAIAALLLRAGSNWQTVRDLLHRGQLAEVEHNGKKYYLRKFQPQGAANRPAAAQEEDAR